MSLSTSCCSVATASARDMFLTRLVSRLDRRSRSEALQRGGTEMNVSRTRPASVTMTASALPLVTGTNWMCLTVMVLISGAMTMEV